MERKIVHVVFGRTGQRILATNVEARTGMYQEGVFQIPRISRDSLVICFPPLPLKALDHIRERNQVRGIIRKKDKKIVQQGSVLDSVTLHDIAKHHGILQTLDIIPSHFLRIKVEQFGQGPMLDIIRKRRRILRLAGQLAKLIKTVGKHFKPDISARKHG